MEVPLLDLTVQHASIREEVVQAVGEVLESQICIGGPRLAELEEAMAGYCGCGYGVGVSSGTDAILSALMSLEIGAGDEVITSPFSFFATAGCIVRVGARPVFVDIEPDTYNIDVSQIGKAITKKTKAIMPVHLFGQMVEMNPLVELAKDRGLYVIEDAAQSIGATYKDRRAGSMGDCGCFSFYPTKNLSAAGDGGAVVTNDSGLAERLRLMRNHGARTIYEHRMVGGNFRLDAIQAAVLLVKLPHLEEWTRGRQANAAYYDRAFADHREVVRPVVGGDCNCVYNQYVVRVPRRDEVAEHLRSKGVGWSIYYPVPLHMQECFLGLGYGKGDFPESEKAAQEVLALPIYPELTDEQQDYVVESVLEGVGC